MQIRARWNAFATSVGNWLISTFWAQVSPTALSKLTWKFYFLFVGLRSYPLCLETLLAKYMIAWDLVSTLPKVPNIEIMTATAEEGKGD